MRGLLANAVIAAAIAGACLISSVSASTSRSATPRVQGSQSFESSVRPFLQKNCLMCHNDQAKVGGLSLAGFHSGADVIAHRDLWELISKRVKDGEMPPKGIPRPSPNAASEMTGWIDGTFDAIDRNAPPDPGRVTAHRLNRFEYNNAVEDLLGVLFRPADDFPADDSGYGFDNIGDVLSVSPVLTEKYLHAAEKIAKIAIPAASLPKPTREKIAAEHRHKYNPTPIGEYVRYSVANEADYAIRATVAGKRVPLRITLLIDNQPVKDAILDDTDGEHQRYIEYPVHLTPGEHRLGAWLRSIPYIAPLGVPPNVWPVKHRSDDDDFGQPPATPWVDAIEVRGPYHPVPAPPTEARKRVFVCDEQNDACAERIIKHLATAAWRRPVRPAEVEDLLHLVQLAGSQGDTFDQGIRLALEGMLVSPNFLFRVERDPANTAWAHPVSDLELASRLSFFLWSSIPDADLLGAAERHELQRPAVLHAQVARMLKSPKAERFIDNFAGQWLELRNLDGVTPDPEKFPEFVDLRDDMRNETRMFFASIMREDRSVLDFIDGPYTFLNERLAQFYGIPGVHGSEFRRVPLNGVQRSGVLTQASVLTVSSYPTRTSPVIRGKWVLENFLNAPPPPPPPNVPALVDSGVGTEVSLRKQLEAHRASPVCASCHSKMDPLGFGLENYNAIGQWRTTDGKFAIDSSGTLPDGKSFGTPAELKGILKANPDVFAQCLTEKLLTYALGRGLERYDRPAVQKIVARLRADNYKFSDLMTGIVESLPFQERRGEGGLHVTQTTAPAHHP